ncbi:MAG: MFS transporter [Candidatus Eisenbacteria bacterium]|nr:MFS transporter [Candidatus Eisenbacteria bacterium]
MTIERRPTKMNGSAESLGERTTERERAGLLGLFRNGNFSLLWSSSLSSQLGDHLNLMALTALIFSLSEGAIKGLEFSKILLLASVPVLVFGPISGVFADRYSRKKLMIASDLLRAGLVAIIPFVTRSMTPVYVIVFLVFTINRFYLSARSAAIPQIVRSDRLLEANSLLNVAMMATIMLGPWGGGLLVEKFGYTWGFLTDAGTYVVSGVLIAFISLRSLSEVKEERRRELLNRAQVLRESAKTALHAHSARELREEAARLGHELAAPIEEEVEVIGSAYERLMRDIREGVAQMKGRGEVVYSTVSFSAVMFVAGLVLVVCPVLVRNEFGLGAADLGMLFSAGGIGMLVGSLMIGRFFRKSPRRGIISLSFLLSGGAIAAVAFATTIRSLGGWIFAVGFFIAPSMVTCDTILQEHMPGESVGKAFGLREMVSKAAFGVAGVLSGIAVDYTGPRNLLLVIAFISLAYSALSLVLFADTSKVNLLNAYPLMRVVSTLASRLPRRISYVIATGLSWIAHLVFVEKRRWARENIARVIGRPPESRKARSMALRMFRSYALYWADFFGLSGGFAGSIRDLVSVEGIEHLWRALERGKGVVFVTAHLGSWDVGGAALSATAGLPDLSAVVEPVSRQTSDYAMTEMREKRGIRVIPLGKPLAIGRALRRNEIVFVVGDRLVGAEGVEVDFLGRPTLFPRGAAYWAQKSGAAIVPGFCIRQPDGSYVGHIEEAILPVDSADDESAVREQTQRIASIMGRYISRYPEQWCMLQPLSSARREA